MGTLEVTKTPVEGVKIRTLFTPPVEQKNAESSDSMIARIHCGRKDRAPQ
jgi:hypothetical protein